MTQSNMREVPDAQIGPSETTEELQARAEGLLTAMTKIRAKVTRAKREAASTGKYADSAWLVRAEKALSFKGQAHQVLLREIARRRREVRQANNNTFERCFIEAARTYLSDGLMKIVLAEAQRLYEAKTAAATIEVSQAETENSEAL